MTGTGNRYPALDRRRYQAIVDGYYVKSSYSNGDGGCLSFTVLDGLVGVQDDKLALAERKDRTLIFNRSEFAAFVAGAKAGYFG